MAMEFSDAVRDATTQDLVDNLNSELGISGAVQFFDGFIPAQCSDPDAGTQLVALALNATPFANAVGNVFSLNTTTPAAAFANGNFVYFRMKNGGGGVVCQGNCGIGGTENIVFNVASVTIGDTVTIDSLDVTTLVTGS
jgi:hypothetical protein